jgi:hypothetical protein
MLSRDELLRRKERALAWQPVVRAELDRRLRQRDPKLVPAKAAPLSGANGHKPT